MNEFSQIMHALHINPLEVIEGAKTKWGFVPYKPGFVGGHCISIDPHYLAFQAKRHGVQPNLILAARKVNDGMTQFVIESMMKLLITNKIETTHLTVGVFGISYKENVPDIRNSLTLKLIKELEEYHIKILVHDPFDHKITLNDHELTLSQFDDMKNLSVAIISVAHDFYKKNLKEILSKCKHPNVLMDIPNLFINDNKKHYDLIYWNL